MAAFPCLNCESPIDLLAFGGFFYPSSLFASAGLGVIVNLSAMAISSIMQDCWASSRSWRWVSQGQHCHGMV
jgi:hypothetical protein